MNPARLYLWVYAKPLHFCLLSIATLWLALADKQNLLNNPLNELFYHPNPGIFAPLVATGYILNAHRRFFRICIYIAAAIPFIAWLSYPIAQATRIHWDRAFPFEQYLETRQPYCPGVSQSSH